MFDSVMFIVMNYLWASCSHTYAGYQSVYIGNDKGQWCCVAGQVTKACVCVWPAYCWVY